MLPHIQTWDKKSIAIGSKKKQNWNPRRWKHRRNKQKTHNKSANSRTLEKEERTRPWIKKVVQIS